MKTINKLVLLEGNEVVLSKEEAIKKLADKLEEAGFLTSCNEFLESVYLRDSSNNSGIWNRASTWKRKLCKRISGSIYESKKSYSLEYSR